MESVTDLSLQHSASDSGTDIDYNCFNSRALKTEYAEDMVMVNPSLVTGTSVQSEQTSGTHSVPVPVSVLVTDGPVLSHIKMTTSEYGGIDLHTLQNLVSNQILLSQQTELNESKEILHESPVSPSCESTVTEQNIAPTVFPSLEADFGCTDVGGKIKTKVTEAVKAGGEKQVEVEQETKKHKGGWPKGRKRKPEKINNAPKPPSNAYRLYTMDRRSELRAKYPGMTFAEQVRRMGAEWSHEVKTEVKKKYSDLAETDRKRYIEELKLYQESESYQEYLNKKCKTKDGDVVSSGSLKTKEVYDPHILYCNLCDIYFSNNHNKTEHLMGSKHVNNLTKQFEAGIKKSAEAGQKYEEQSGVMQLEKYEEHDESLDVERFVLEFTQKNHNREQEMHHLKERIVDAQRLNSELAQEFLEHQKLVSVMDQELTTLKFVTSSLKEKLDSLHTVPTMFGLAKLL